MTTISCSKFSLSFSVDLGSTGLPLFPVPIFTSNLLLLLLLSLSLSLSISQSLSLFDQAKLRKGTPPSFSSPPSAPSFLTSDHTLTSSFTCLRLLPWFLRMLLPFPSPPHLLIILPFTNAPCLPGRPRLLVRKLQQHNLHTAWPCHFINFLAPLRRLECIFLHLPTLQ